MKTLIFTLFFLITSVIIFAQETFNIASNVTITTDKEYVFEAKGTGPFVIAFSFHSQNSTTTTVKLYQSTDNGRTYHAYPDMPSIPIALLSSKTSAFRDPWSCQATHFKVVVALESGKRINGFYLTYKPR